MNAIEKQANIQIIRSANMFAVKKSDNIELGSVIPLPDGRKGAVVEEVENIGKNKRI